MLHRISFLILFFAFLTPVYSFSAKGDYKKKPELILSGSLFDIYYEESRFMGSYKARWIIKNKTDATLKLRTLDATYNCSGVTQNKTHYFSTKMKPGDSKRVIDTVCYEKELKGKTFIGVKFDQYGMNTEKNKFDCDDGSVKSVAYEYISDNIVRAHGLKYTLTFNRKDLNSTEMIKVRERGEEFFKTTTKGENEWKKLEAEMEKEFCNDKEVESSTIGAMKRNIVDLVDKFGNKEFCEKNPGVYPCIKKNAGPGIR